MDKNRLDALYQHGNEEHWGRLHGNRVDWRTARDWVSRYVPRQGTILDVGCWDGEFLRSVGADRKRLGIEIHQAAYETARETGVEIVGTDFSVLKHTTIRVDAVASFDVIEHTHNPADFIRNLSAVTREDGIVIVSSGNSQALSWRLLGAKYWYCTIAEHLSFISPRWCKWIAPRVGLELKEVVTFSHARGDWRQRLAQLAANLFYVASPAGFAKLRASGFGGSEFRQHKELLRFPPNWMSSRDHFICLFVKRCAVA